MQRVNAIPGPFDVRLEVAASSRACFWTASLNWLVGYTASTIRHAAARLPFTPSTSVAKKSARSRRT
jgi:hypothetical protein